MKFEPLGYSKLNTYSIKKRKSKVNLNEFYKTKEKNFINSLPEILAGKDLKEIINFSVNSVKNRKKIITSIGAHVIKVGLNPLFIELFNKKIISHLAVNGACIIHDFELAIAGATSEDVEKTIIDGKFGMSEETGKYLNQAIIEGYKKKLGLGEAVAEFIEKNNFSYKNYSIIYNAYKNNIPVTVHVAIGTDIIHMHPDCSGEALGFCSLLDFKIFCNSIKDLTGGVYFNIGSAVIMPEVFLKAITLVRNLGYVVKDFITVNMDFISHYRPLQNVVKRPVKNYGKGYNLIGHHEIMVPLLFRAILENIEGGA